MDFVQRKVNNLGRKVATFPHVETIGRTLFASSFFLSAFNDYMEVRSNWEGGEDYSGEQIKHLMTISIIMKIFGGLIFIYGSFFGAFLLLLHQGIITMIHFDFYNHSVDIAEFGLAYHKFKMLMNETLSYDTAHDIYKSNFDEQKIEEIISKFRDLKDDTAIRSALFGHNEFVGNLLSFIKGLALIGALLFFLVMKHKLDKAKKESKVKID